MTKTLIAAKRPAKQKSRATALPQMRQAEEFEADTQEDRSIDVLAQKRRRFLANLEAQGAQSPEQK